MEKPHTFGGSLLDRLIDMEASEGSGDPGGSGPAADMPAVEAGADPAPPAAPEAEGESGGAPSSGEPEAPAWAGPSQDEWQALQDRQQQMLDWLSAQAQAPAGQPQEEGPSDEQLIDVLENARLEGDFRTEVAVFQELQRRAVQAQLGPAAPALQAAEEQYAEQLARGWLTELNVPESDWEDVALLGQGFRSAMPNVDGRQAAAVAYQRMQERDQRIRADERQKIQQEQQTEQERLRAIAGAPSTPAGPGGVESSFRDDEDEVAGWRRFRERQTAAAGQ